MDIEYKKQLEKQHYKFIGEHTAIKICEWTKKSIKGQGVCYKQKFYGINSHRCIQMSPVVNFCDHDCIFCWRKRNNSPFEKVDEPEGMFEKMVEAQRKLLVGLKGYDKTDKKKLKEAQNPIHIAISLTGETLYYPKLSQLLTLLHEKGVSTFIVSNGQLPEVFEKMILPTQFYLSLDAPNEEMYKKIDKPMRRDGWNRLMKSMDIMKKRKNESRMAIRITLIKGINDIYPEQYANLIKRAEPHFVEVKAFMLLGASRERLTIANMPLHKEVREFSEKIADSIGWRIIDESRDSRVCLLMKEDFEGRIMKF